MTIAPLVSLANRTVVLIYYQHRMLRQLISWKW